MRTLDAHPDALLWLRSRGCAWLVEREGQLPAAVILQHAQARYLLAATPLLNVVTHVLCDDVQSHGGRFPQPAADATAQRLDQVTGEHRVARDRPAVHGPLIVECRSQDAPAPTLVHWNWQAIRPHSRTAVP